MEFGRYLEEFTVGETIVHYPGRTITEGDHMLFCMLTMNHHPVHIDANFASKTQFGRQLVAGTLVFSLVAGMTVRDISGKAIANLEYTEVKHLAPTFHGDTLYAQTTILDKRESRTKPDRGVVSVETVAFNQRSEKVLSFKRSILIPKRTPGQAAVVHGADADVSP